MHDTETTREWRGDRELRSRTYELGLVSTSETYGDCVQGDTCTYRVVQGRHDPSEYRTSG